MSTHYRRHYMDGTAALDAARPALREHHSIKHRRGDPQGIADQQATVVELHPGGSLRKDARRAGRLLGSEAGMATAEYAIATLAAVGFAGLLVFILRSEEVRGFLLNLIRTALALP
ncbi:DUF4244 domain-containing protein [Pseudarthrobacter sp. NamB4]|uniref:DUF4244 domain-containing protein n=1 Tax=Pseudarthrobacter sp. NamB4 TaxID=2576837 RepID=UPI0010FD7436|nr:DUF4244 domain-containing protein [Pseudarthrobacter sp. NamB4]TLM72332.1 DUF4244 domain-containing protein [Pseudarthrobacter sp. NamB4]